MCVCVAESEWLDEKITKEQGVVMNGGGGEKER